MQDVGATTYAVQSAASHNEANASGVSWAAVFAGALAAAALYLILLSLGAGLGLSSVSPWSGASAKAIGASAIVWLIVTEALSSAMGGYLAGRLRTKWSGIHSDEVYFRDTAHGFLAWCTALVLTAAFLASAATALLGHSIAAKPTQAAQNSGEAASAETYFVDKLLRGGNAKADAASAHAEAAVILTKSLAKGAIASDDRSWLDQLVAAQTGLSASEADTRVSAVFADAQQAEETTRKTVAYSLLWMFLALLIGAFTASVMATIGGRQRDNVVLI